MTDRRRVRGTKKTTVDGITFDSKREATRWAELCLLQKAGDISNLERQVSIELHGKNGPILTPKGKVMRYVADFKYVDWTKGGAWVIEDAKGYPTDVFKMKRAILSAQGVEVVTV